MSESMLGDLEIVASSSPSTPEKRSLDSEEGRNNIYLIIFNNNNNK